MEESCNQGYGLDGGNECVPCDIDDAFSYKSKNDGTCEVASCKPGFHVSGNACVSNTEICVIANGEGVKNWSASGWGTCVVSDCDADYHIENNACVPDEEDCAIADGTGVRYWTGSAAKGKWSDCGAKICNAGFTSDRALTNDWSVPCGRCSNYYGYDGAQAASSYSSECNIAACMYQGQKYILQNNECVAICETRSDETGIMEFSGTTCDRSCNAGYIDW
jgi:hypothetical protein